MAPTILSRQAHRDALPDLSPESIDFLIRERGILYLAGEGFSRDEAKRLIFTGWRILRLKQRELDAMR